MLFFLRAPGLPVAIMGPANLIAAGCEGTILPTGQLLAGKYHIVSCPGHLHWHERMRLLQTSRISMLRTAEEPHCFEIEDEKRVKS